MKVFAFLPPASLSGLDHMRLLRNRSMNSTFNEPSVTSAVGHLFHCCAMRTKHFASFALQARCRPESQQSNSGQAIKSSVGVTSTKCICFYNSCWCSAHPTSDWKYLYWTGRTGIHWHRLQSVSLLSMWQQEWRTFCTEPFSKLWHLSLWMALGRVPCNCDTLVSIR